jgi:SAM-dependent methyltransferase
MGLRDDETYYKNPNPSAIFWRRYLDPKDIPEYVEGPLVLDAGCGNGRNLPVLESLGIEAVGLEINDDLVAAAAARGQVVQSSLTKIPFRDGAFSTSLVAGVMWYVRDIGSAHSELRRVCRKHYTWSYAKFYRLSLLKPRNLFYFVKSLLLGRIFPRSRSKLLEFGDVLKEDEKGYLFISGRDAPKAPSLPIRN